MAEVRNGMQVTDTEVAPETGGWPQTLSQFELLVERMQHELVHFAFCLLAHRADAEDAVQDVLVRAWRDRAVHRHVTNVRPYLFRMVRNRCTDTLRSRSRGSNRDGTAEQQCPERSEPASAQGDLLAREEALRLERLLRHVPDAEAEVIRLRVWSELTFADIAAAVQSSVPTVKSRFRYGVDKLRRLLAEEDDPQRGHRR